MLRNVQGATGGYSPLVSSIMNLFANNGAGSLVQKAPTGQDWSQLLKPAPTLGPMDYSAGFPVPSMPNSGGPAGPGLPNLPQFGFGTQPQPQNGPGLAQQLLSKLSPPSNGGVDIPNGPNNSPADVPLPTPRPASAPQDDSAMPWWMRNAYQQKDPETGAYLDPTLASRASAVTGHDIIKRMLSSFTS